METNKFRLKDFHTSYLRRGGKMDKKVFKLIIQTFLKNVLTKLYEGEKFTIGYRMGTLQIGRFERNPSKPVMDYGESNKIKAKLLSEGKELYNKETGQGYKWVVFHTDPYYYGFLWKKEIVRALGRSALKNLAFYSFEPFAKTKRTLSNNIDESSILIYEFQPHFQRRNHSQSNERLPVEQYQLEGIGL